MTYVISDIHGNLRRFNSILEQINLHEEDTLYVLGDVIDRHPDGIKILRKLMHMPNVKMLLGNHEHMMLEALDISYNLNDFSDCFTYERRLSRWYYNGGDVTHNYIKHIRKSTRSEIFNYLRNLPLNIDITVNNIKYKLIHAAPLNHYPEYRDFYDDPTIFAVWKRWGINDPDDEEAILVFGHSTTSHFQESNPLKIWYSRNGKRIGIDCGSGYPNPGESLNTAYSGRLACLRLDDFAEFYSDESLIVKHGGK